MDIGDLLDLSRRASRAPGPDPVLDAAICAVARISHPHPAMTCLDDWNWTPRGARVAAQKRGEGMTISWEPLSLTSDEKVAAEMLAASYRNWILIDKKPSESTPSLYRAIVSPPAGLQVKGKWPLTATACTKALVICSATLLLLAELETSGFAAKGDGGEAMYV